VYSLRDPDRPLRVNRSGKILIHDTDEDGRASRRWVHINDASIALTDLTRRDPSKNRPRSNSESEVDRRPGVGVSRILSFLCLALILVSITLVASAGVRDFARSDRLRQNDVSARLVSATQDIASAVSDSYHRAAAIVDDRRQGSWAALRRLQLHLLQAGRHATPPEQSEQPAQPAHEGGGRDEVFMWA